MLGGLAATLVMGSIAGFGQVKAKGNTSAPQFPRDFDKLAEDYAHFSSTPESERVFYALKQGRIVSERLTGDWKATCWGKPPALPVPGCSHDDVPMISPIRGLAGEGPYKPTCESLLHYDCPDWYRDAKFGIWNHWSLQCVP